MVSFRLFVRSLVEGRKIENIHKSAKAVPYRKLQQREGSGTGEHAVKLLLPLSLSTYRSGSPHTLLSKDSGM